MGIAFEEPSHTPIHYDENNSNNVSLLITKKRFFFFQFLVVIVPLYLSKKTSEFSLNQEQNCIATVQLSLKTTTKLERFSVDYNVTSWKVCVRVNYSQQQQLVPRCWLVFTNPIINPVCFVASKRNKGFLVSSVCLIFSLRRCLWNQTSPINQKKKNRRELVIIIKRRRPNTEN